MNTITTAGGGASTAARVDLLLSDVGSVRVKAIRGEDALSSLFQFELWAEHEFAEAPPSAESLLGVSAQLILRDVWGSERRIQAIVAEFEIGSNERGGCSLRVQLRPRTHLLTLGKDSRTFRDLSVVEIAQQVLAGYGVEARFELVQSYPKRAYVAQYEESDFDFLSRLLEEEGIFYFHDHASESVLVIGDHSTSAAELDQGGYLPSCPIGNQLSFRAQAGLVAPEPFVRSLGVRARAHVSGYQLGSFDFARPAFKVAAATSQEPLAVYDAPGAGTEDPVQLARFARVRTERALASAAVVVGRTPSVRISPGRQFGLGGHDQVELVRSYLITKLQLPAQSVSTMADDSGPLEFEFFALPLEVPFRPSQRTPIPRHPGLSVGTVVGPAGSEVHPDRHGRVRVVQRWDRTGERDEHAGRWLRVVQRGTGASVLLPRVGFNLVAMAEEGSADQPLALARTIDGTHPPIYPLPQHKTRTVFRTRSSPGNGKFNELRFEDQDGAEELHVRASRDLNIDVGNSKSEAVFGNASHKIGQNQSLSVGATEDARVAGHQSVAVSGSQTEQVGGERKKTVNGSEGLRVAALRLLRTGGNAVLSAARRTLIVGAANTSLALGAITERSPVINRLVGGAMLKATPLSMSELVSSGLSIQGIGGSKQEICLSRSVSVKSGFSEDVGGGVKIFAKAAAIEEASGNLSIAAGGTAYIKGKTISISSGSRVVIDGGGAVLEVTADHVSIVAANVSSSGEAAIAGAHVELN